jgi:hypothetical protein
MLAGEPLVPDDPRDVGPEDLQDPTGRQLDPEATALPLLDLDDPGLPLDPVHTFSNASSRPKPPNEFSRRTFFRGQLLLESAPLYKSAGRQVGGWGSWLLLAATDMRYEFK